MSNGYLTFAELSAAQKLELKENLIIARNDESGESTSWGELAWADDVISDDEIEAEYGGTLFTAEDFECTRDKKDVYAA